MEKAICNKRHVLHPSHPSGDPYDDAYLRPPRQRRCHSPVMVIAPSAEPGPGVPARRLNGAVALKSVMVAARLAGEPEGGSERAEKQNL